MGGGTFELTNLTVETTKPILEDRFSRAKSKLKRSDTALVYSAGGPPTANIAAHMRPHSFAVGLKEIGIQPTLYDTGYRSSCVFSFQGLEVVGSSLVPQTMLESDHLRLADLPKLMLNSLSSRRAISRYDHVVTFQFPTTATLSSLWGKGLVVDMTADGLEYYTSRSWLKWPARKALQKVNLISHRTDCYLDYLRRSWGFSGEAFRVYDIVPENFWNITRDEARKQLSLPADSHVLAIVGRTGNPALATLERLLANTDCLVILAGAQYLTDPTTLRMKAVYKERVILPGVVSQARVPIIINSADAIPMWYDPNFPDFPQKFAECVSSNAKVVSNKFRGVNEVGSLVDNLVDSEAPDAESQFEECLIRSFEATNVDHARKSRARALFCREAVSVQMEKLLEYASALQP